MRRRTTRREARFNALCTALLLGAIVVVGNRIARYHLVHRTDFSEDQLYAVSAGARTILARIDDPLQVKAYLTGKVRSGELALGKARLEGMLGEYTALSGGLMRVDKVDPEVSTKDLLDAQEYGITPFPSESVDGAIMVKQDVFFGFVLRYRGREEVIPFAVPANFESTFCSKIHSLMRDSRPVIGWYGRLRVPGSREANFGTFEEARALLSAEYELRDVSALRDGASVPADIDVLLVVQPDSLHPRAAFEIDQYVQRGGSLIVAIDEVVHSRRDGQGHRMQATGLEQVLAAWGVHVLPYHLWDDSHAAQPMSVEVVIDGRSQKRSVDVPYPPYVLLREQGFNDELPPTAALQQGLFMWAQPIDINQPPEGIERQELVKSSPQSYRVPLIEGALSIDEGEIKSQSEALYAQRKPLAFSLAVSLSGKFPSAFEADGAPEFWDPFSAAGDSSSGGTTDEDVLSRASDARVIVFGDTDWMRDQYLTFNRALFQNVVSWLTLEDDLVQLRSRQAKRRPLKDFYVEEIRARGLHELPADESLAQSDRRRRLEEEARKRAQTRRWRAMLVPLLTTLALVLGFGLIWNLRQRSGGGQA